MSLWKTVSDFFNVEDENDTVESGTHPQQPTSSERPDVRVRTDADGSIRMIINTNGGNYNERIDGDYIQGTVIKKNE